MLQRKIEEIPSETLIDSWLILDATSFKESLLLLIRNWSSAYKKKLVELKSQGKLRKVEDDGLVFILWRASLLILSKLRQKDVLDCWIIIMCKQDKCI